MKYLKSMNESNSTRLEEIEDVFLAISDKYEMKIIEIDNNYFKIQIKTGIELDDIESKVKGYKVLSELLYESDYYLKKLNNVKKYDITEMIWEIQIRLYFNITEKILDIKSCFNIDKHYSLTINKNKLETYIYQKYKIETEVSDFKTSHETEYDYTDMFNIYGEDICSCSIKKELLSLVDIVESVETRSQGDCMEITIKSLLSPES